MVRSVACLAVGVLLGFAAGCSAGGDEKSSAGPRGASAESDADGSESSADGANSSALCAKKEVAQAPLRRLTRFEYANTVRDLLGVDPSPANELPVDEVTDGFNNNAGVLTVSPLHAEKYVLVAEALAKAAVAKDLAALTRCDAAAKGEEPCALAFARSFGRRAFRRPVVAQDEQLLMMAYSAGRTGGSYAEGIEVMIRASLQSAHFLYRLEPRTSADTSGERVALNQFELATRMSYLLWASAPDDKLLDMAAAGELDSKRKVAAKAREMLKEPKARVAITDFFNQWMGTNRLELITKSSALFPTYSAALRDAMAQELPAFVEYVLWSGDRKIDTLLTAPIAFVSGPLAELYGLGKGAQSSTPRMVMLPESQGRAGILTQAGFAAVQAHPDQTSPVLRGKFIRTKLLCQPPPPPPPDADITVPDVTEAATARERFSAHLTAASGCMGCHRLMDPIGLAFENFDAIGQYREREGGKSIDVSGELFGSSDPSLQGKFTGVRELAEKLADSEQVRDCVATQWFRFAAGRSEDEPDACSVATLQETFSSSGGDLMELLVGMTQTDAFWYRASIPRSEKGAP